MSHTPGPWATEINEYGSRRIGVVFAGGRNIARICGKGSMPQPAANSFGALTDESDANARLIAAAPDMLKALERAEFCIRGYTDSSKRECDLDAIRAAIAKAKGEQ